jgi:aryl-alcohol dehydrogenase-like predicted oxidoreductase
MSFSKKLILGTANFNSNYGILNNKVSNNKIKSTLNYARKKNILFLDTSRDYKLSNIKYINEYNNFKIFKKIDLDDIFFSKGNLEKNISTYLFGNKNSKLSCYAVTLRKPTKFFSYKGKRIISFLQKLKKNNKIKKIGISIYNAKNLKKIIKKFKIDFIQLPYNLTNLDTLKKTKKIIRGKKIEIHLRSIFLQGLLLKNKDQIPERLKKLKKYWSKLEKILEINGFNQISACLNHALSAKPDKIIIGINNKKHLDEILKIKIKKFKMIKLNIIEKKLIDPIYWSKLKLNN